MPDNNEASQDEDYRCPHPHRFSEAWLQFKTDVVDKATRALSPGEVASVKFPYAAGYAAAMSVVIHLLDVGEDARASLILSLLGQDAALSLRNAEEAMPDRPATAAPAVPSGANLH